MCVNPLTISFKGETRRLRQACGLPVSILVPCGKCSECSKKKATSWGVRAYKEFLFAPAGSVRFVTITYDDANIPVTDKGNKTLDSADCKQFLKSLRQNLFRKYGVTIRFMCAGEYGSRTFRPHYHFLFYGIPSHLTNVEFKQIIGSVWHRCKVIDVQFPKNGASSGFYVGKYMSKSGYSRAYKIAQDDEQFCMPFKRASIGFGNQFTDAERAYYLAEDISDLPGDYSSPSMDVTTYTMADLFEDANTPPVISSSVDTSYPPSPRKLPFPSSHVTPSTAKFWHDDYSGSEAMRWLEVFGKSPRFIEIVRRYHQCHRPLKDGSYVNIDFPEYLAIKLYGKDLYKDIRRCIAFARQRQCEIECDPAAVLLEPGSFAATHYNDWLRYRSGFSDPYKPLLDFEGWLIMEHDRLNRQSSLELRRSRESDNLRDMYKSDVF